MPCTQCGVTLRLLSLQVGLFEVQGQEVQLPGARRSLQQKLVPRALGALPARMPERCVLGALPSLGMGEVLKPALGCWHGTLVALKLVPQAVVPPLAQMRVPQAHAGTLAQMRVPQAHAGTLGQTRKPQAVVGTLAQMWVPQVPVKLVSPVLEALAGVQAALQKLVPPVVGALPGMLHLALGVL